MIETAATPSERAGNAAATRAGASQVQAPAAGRSRVIVENIVPLVDGGRFPVKRSVGELVRVEADAFVDGHDKIGVAIRHRSGNASEWREAEMAPLVNDRWAGEFPVHAVGWHEFTVVAWVDRFATWRYDLQKRVGAGQNVSVDLLIGAELVEEAARATEGDVSRSLSEFGRFLRSDSRGEATEIALGPSLQTLMRQHGPRLFVTEYPTPVKMWVDRTRARFSSWYEFFPRSASAEPGKHGTLRDVAGRMDYVAKMGFDVVYLPPIHPIGRAFRKGRNNSPVAEPGDVGSPWAIGGPEGGHDAIHPQLGTIGDFDHLIASANDRGIEIALDLAFQCSPDHPYVKEHPQWFRHRPDGTIQYAENPPKKYQDIYPFDFECDDWQNLWNELLRVTMHWVQHGVRIFRVDNPHTKPFPFWEWLIAEVKRREPAVLFLAEAFTRPKVMYRLAKLGFTQSYTYFAWRNDPWSIKQYYTELTAAPVVDFFRPNAWPNTPDILNEYLQTDARSAYVVRAVLAATLCANYGIYGPTFELMDGRPVRHGSEEYLDSEKYQIRQWDLDNPHSLTDLLGRLNRIRKSNPALQTDRGLMFHKCDNESVVVFSKTLGDNVILVAANTDPYHTQWANLDLNLAAMGLTADQPFQVHDLLTDARYRWQGHHAVVGLDPGTTPVHVFAVRRRSRTEHDFEYFV
ncbi:MAG TPA: alpha-1,4-glucan--maltose-1-phosphate maltosyltransferase [Tepidisphaeraceae bacterium]|jgi:starch synthase (maltosyl-transferring)|nr:alpha-1,4-glucan--maltose-1-phosphate maltosyltransferase [Tepidisphaeraceae bacterium]